MSTGGVLKDGAGTIELKQFIQIASTTFALPQFQRPPPGIGPIKETF